MGIPRVPFLSGRSSPADPESRIPNPESRIPRESLACWRQTWLGEGDDQGEQEKQKNKKQEN